MCVRTSIMGCFLFLLGACASKQRKDAVLLYDAAVMKEFMLSIASMDTAKIISATDSFLLKTQEDSAVYNQTTNYLEKSFGDPNSPYRNEEIYIHLLQQKLRSKWYSSLQKEKYRNILYLRMQNRPGTAANDFEYLTPSGARKRMYELKADYTLLLFYNPECEACKEVRKELIKSEVINRPFGKLRMKVLAIYTDKDEKVWLDHLPEMPKEWIHGRDDHEYLFKNNIYDLKAIPTVYLLDRDKKVLLKDCMDIARIEQKLEATE